MALAWFVGNECMVCSVESLKGINVPIRHKL